MYRTIEALMGQVGVAPPGKLTIMQGQTIRMTVAFSYKGKGPKADGSLDCTLRCSIGLRSALGFDEIVFTTKVLNLPQSVGFLAYTASADIITTLVLVGLNYDIEAKIEEYADTTLVKLDNVIDVAGAPEFSAFKITDYSLV